MGNFAAREESLTGGRNIGCNSHFDPYVSAASADLTIMIATTTFIMLCALYAYSTLNALDWLRRCWCTVLGISPAVQVNGARQSPDIRSTANCHCGL